eukprot:CCRYP_014524-RA/>CCRYP_014524-RA protein AED:0.00 eAED:0.00 QI:35/1/1/1/0/0/3/292/121
MASKELKETDCICSRPAAARTKLLRSLSGTEQSCSRNNSFSDEDVKLDTKNSTETSTQLHTSGVTLIRTVSFISCPKQFFSCQSSQTWGHKPSPIVGMLCFLFLHLSHCYFERAATRLHFS